MATTQFIQILKDYAPFVVPLLCALIAALTSVILFQRKERERVHCSVEWKDVHQSYEAAPYLITHNRSERSVAILSVRYRSGAIFKRHFEGTALGYEDPEDYDFPYLIEPDKLLTLQLDAMFAHRVAETASPLARVLARFGKPRVRVEITTTANRRASASAENVIPRRLRPAWVKRSV